MILVLTFVNNDCIIHYRIRFNNNSYLGLVYGVCIWIITQLRGAITGGRESNSVESLYFCIWIAAPK